MAAPVWQPGTLYLPGDLVQPITMPAPTTTAISNAGFELGSFANWTAVGSVALAGGGYGGSSACAEFSGSAGVARIEHDPVAVVPGVRIRAQCMYAQGSADAGQNSGAVFLTWLTAGDVEISEDVGNLVTSSSGGGWKPSVVTAYAPAGAAKVVIGCLSNRTNSAVSKADAFGWDYAASTLPAGLIYQAVQAAAGHSAADEPDWPPTLGVTVVDNEVTWEAVATSRVTWTASPLFTSGATEPDWPTEPGERVVDNTIAWECVTRRVTDEHCPNTTVVAIIAAKVLAVDGDIVRHSAAANPLDWTTSRNAGFLATGLQQANASDFAVLAPYRNNLACFNAHCFQHWQMDPDPELCAQLDQLDGVGSLWPRAAVAVSNELFYLTAVGVRSIGIAVGAQNLAAGDVGEPIDDLVQEALRVAEANSSDVLATYYPGMGQYWLAFADYPPPALAITGDLPDGTVGDSGSYQYQASGGVRPYTYAITAGSLPPGASMDAGGLVSYTFSTGGSYAWTVTVTDADGSTATVDDDSTIVADPLFGDVFILLHFNGANGSTDVVDVNPLNNTPPVVWGSRNDTSPGNLSTLTTANAKWGASSLRVNQTGFPVISLLNSGDNPCNVVEGDFTVDIWAYPDSVAAGIAVMAAQDDNVSFNQGFQLRRNGSKVEWVAWSTTDRGSAWGLTSSGDLVAGAWQWVRVCKTGTGGSTVTRMWLDGVFQGSSTNTYNTSSTTIAVGNTYGGTEGGLDGPKWNGDIDDFRITKAARSTTDDDLTVPTGPWPDSELG